MAYNNVIPLPTRRVPEQREERTYEVVAYGYIKGSPQLYAEQHYFSQEDIQEYKRRGWSELAACEHWITANCLALNEIKAYSLSCYERITQDNGYNGGWKVVTDLTRERNLVTLSDEEVQMYRHCMYL